MLRVALHHRTAYRYARPIGLGPQVIRLRPAVHCRTPIESYSLDVRPADHFLNWQQDPHGNFLARCVFPGRVQELAVTVDLIANQTVINPFDFFLEPAAEQYPFEYPSELVGDLKPFRKLETAGPLLHGLLGSVDRRSRRTVDFLVDLNREVHRRVEYVVRMEPGVQTPEETLALSRGSCRDSAWLLTQLLRHLGLAARFASGYLIQLKADVASLDGPSGPAADFTDLHAWTEVYLPGAGWIGLDPTSGLLTGEGHVPLACAPHPTSAAPITGAHEPCEVEFDFDMSLTRVHEDPRVTKPYTEEQWERIDSAGRVIDEALLAGDVRLTMGGEPTFVSIDDMEGDEWQTAALGEHKKRLAFDLMLRLKDRLGPGGLLHFGQGKWYPGEQIPRWAMRCLWRLDGEPLWTRPDLFALEGISYGHTVEDALQFARSLAARLDVDAGCVMPAMEDVLYYLWRERRLPANVNPRDARLNDDLERRRLARLLERGLATPTGAVLPLRYAWWEAEPRWRSGSWHVRAEELFLLPGDSPMGFRLPLQSLLHDPAGAEGVAYAPDPLQAVAALPRRVAWLRQLNGGDARPAAERDDPASPRAATAWRRVPQQGGSGERRHGGSSAGGAALLDQALERRRHGGNGAASDPPAAGSRLDLPPAARRGLPEDVIRTALCVEPREGRLHVFMPPCDRLENYLQLVAAVEETAAELQLPVMLEGYVPPADPRIQEVKVTPDPGVVEVNVPPAASWEELKQITCGVYDDARYARLGTEKFDRDGSHTGSGGGNHVVMGGPTPADSPWLRRPDLLKSFVSYWQNHPALTYLFSGKFVGPTSQAPRVDEGRADALYELQIACDLIQAGRATPAWQVDRIFRNLLTDGVGNTHRAEFCIDKLYSPDSASGRLGLVEFRAFEMPPHARMSLAQLLLMRALAARFWKNPYEQRLVDWGTSLHDRFLLPYFLWLDFEDVVEETRRAGFPLEAAWYRPHFEFRFPRIGEIAQRGVHVELRRAIEPWYVLGEEPVGGFTARYVDSSVERLQVRVRGLTDPRFVVACNGRRVPLQPTGVEGEFVAGVRYRAWQPPSCLHPTIGVDSPLVFDLFDAWLGRSLGGCQYHVGHPGGLNPATFPVNAFEAESRRGARFFPFGHTGGPSAAPPPECSREFPFTLDLRRRPPRGPA